MRKSHSLKNRGKREKGQEGKRLKKALFPWMQHQLIEEKGDGQIT
jgi:hypothetical protein